MGFSNSIDDPSNIPKYKVSLRSTSGQFLVVFDVTPGLSESRSVQYDRLQVTHMPGNILVYKNTESRNFNLSDAKLISRTPAEARKNLIRLNTLRAWQMPYFGTSSKQLQSLESQQNKPISEQSDTGLGHFNLTQQIAAAKTSFLTFLGAPPDVLYLSAYAGSDAGGIFEGNINSVPVVMTNFEFSYPNDVDYIPVGGVGGETEDNFVGSPFPTIMSLSIQLQEIHSPREFSNFNIDDYRNGNLPRF